MFRFKKDEYDFEKFFVDLFDSQENRSFKFFDCQKVLYKMQKSLVSIRELLSLVKKYPFILGQCCGCFGFYLQLKDPESLYAFKKLGDCERQILVKALKKLNRAFPPVFPEVLIKNHFEELSHGVCDLCLAGSKVGDVYREEQKSKSFRDCFGTALVSCDQEGCKYFKDCVMNEEDYHFWHRRALFLQKAERYKFKIISR